MDVDLHVAVLFDHIEAPRSVDIVAQLQQGEWILKLLPVHTKKEKKERKGNVNAHSLKRQHEHEGRHATGISTEKTLTTAVWNGGP